MRESPVVRGVLILAIVALVGALAFSIYGLASMPTGPKGTPRATDVWQGAQSQRDFAAAEAQARDRAEAWKPDAALVQAEGSWRIGERWTEVEAPPVAWFFSYYSAEAGQIATAGVSDGGVSWTAPRAVQVAPRPMATFPPAQGPETAWLSFRAYDGERFLGQHTGALVKLRLIQEEAGLTWRVSALKPHHHLNVKIDAETGAQAQLQN
jgi:hypothetical protein